MKKNLLLLVFILLFISLKGQSKQDTIVISNPNELRLIGKQVYYFEDESANLSLNDILKPEYQHKFKPHTKDAYTRPASRTAVWFKIILQNKTDENLWIETGGAFSCWYIDFYRPDSLGNYGKPVETGSLRPYESREFPTNFFWLKLATENNSRVQTFYIKMSTGLEHDYNLKVGSIKALYKNKEKFDFLTAIYIGIMLIMILYNSYLGFAIRERIYIIYVSYILVALFGFPFLNSYPLLSNNFWFWEHVFVWVSLPNLLVCLFAISFLDLPKTMPRIYKLLLVWIFLLLVIVVLNLFFFEPTVLDSIFQAFLSFLFFTLIGAGIYLYIKKNKNARFYLLGWSFIMGSLIIYFLASNSIIPSNVFLRNATYFGASLEALMFSFALVDRLNTLRREKELTQAENMRLIQQQSIVLEQKVIERTSVIQKQKAELELTNATKDRFFSIISHDLKNPISAYVELTKILYDNILLSDIDNAREVAKSMLDSSEKTYELLLTLLEWSRLQRGLIDNKPENIDVAELIDKNIDFAKSSAESKNIQIKVNSNGKAIAFADKNMITTVIRNILSNAIKFTPTGGTITFSTQIDQQSNDLIVSIADTGIGLPKQHIDKLFRIDVHNSDIGTCIDGKGTGLGLILCKDLITVNKGRIWVESELGKGTTFYFSIPLNNQ